MQNRDEKIPVLIYKHIIGNINPEEQKELDKWKGESEDNRNMFRRVTDPDFLDTEFRRRKSVCAVRALEDMKRRINTHASPVRPGKWTLFRPVCYVGAALLFLSLGGTLVMQYRDRMENPLSEMMDTGEYEMIKHGETRATLILGNGMSVELGRDTLKNRVAIRSASVKTVSALAEADSVRGPNTLHLSIPRGGEFKFTLEDGTEVWLNAESQLIYPETFEGAERRVELSGEAYFKVAKDAGKPFVVECSGQEVRVTGTEFNIQCYREEPNVYTTLVSGGIILKPIDVCSGELLLTPGRQVVLDKTCRQAEVRTVDTNVVTSWTQGRFVFENQTLEQIMRMLGRWYDFTYTFDDDKIGNTLFMGSIPRYGEFGDVVRILEASGGLRFDVEGKNVRILKK